MLLRLFLIKFTGAVFEQFLNDKVGQLLVDHDVLVVRRVVRESLQQIFENLG